LSPVIHTAALAHHGRDAVYLAFDVDPADVSVAVVGLRAIGAAGVNVTVPYKESVLREADTVDDLAGGVGAANTLVFTTGGVSAHNTDVAGVIAALTGLGSEVKGRPWLIVGGGGAAGATAWAARLSGAGTLMVANRNRTRAESLVASLRERGQASEPVDWDRRGEAAAGAGMIVNATSVGMMAEQSPLEPGWLKAAAASGCAGVLDLVYGREETPLVRSARRAGMDAADGLEMLVQQAAEAYRLWWEDDAPVDVMRQAASTALGRTGRGTGSSEVPPLV
jgi:shikimate dehydrogenase